MTKVDLSDAIDSINKGNLVVYPTDTLYALGADIFNKDAAKKVFILKNRPFSNPIPVAVANIDEMSRIAYIDKSIKSIVDKFLPGALTIILRKKNIVPNIVTAGLDNIAIRIPNNKIALKLLLECGPLTVTSANLHDKKTPDIINDIMMLFSTNISSYIDGGILNGKPSTIVDLTNRKPKIIRQGDINIGQILDAIYNG